MNITPSRLKSGISHLLAVLIVAVTYFTCLKGIEHQGHFDEGSYLGSTRHMLQTGIFLPGWYGYPSLIFYLSLLPLVEEALDYIEDERPIENLYDFLTYMVAEGDYITQLRHISMPWAALASLWLYIFVLRWRQNHFEALVAAALLGFSWEIAYHSRWFSPDPLMLGFTTLTLMGIGIAHRSARPKFWLQAAAVAAGFATGSKYTGGVLLMPLFSAAWFHLKFGELKNYFSFYTYRKININSQWKPGSIATNGKTLLVEKVQEVLWLYFQLLFWFSLAYLITTPATILQPGTFFEALLSQRGVYSSPGANPYSVFTTGEHLQKMLTYFSSVVFSHYSPIALFFFGMMLIGLYALKQDKWLAGVLLPIVIFYVWYFSTYRLMIIRNLLILVPFFAVIAAVGCGYVQRKIVQLCQTRTTLPFGVSCSILPALLLILTGFNVGWLWHSGDTIDRQRNNPHFAELQARELVDYMKAHPDQHFVLSHQVQTLLETHVGDLPPNIGEGSHAETYGVFNSLEVVAAHPFVLLSNRHRFFQMLPSGPYDINMDYYSTWVGPNRMLIAPMPMVLQEVGAVFSSDWHLDAQSLKQMDKERLPTPIIVALKVLQNRKFPNREAFTKAVYAEIGEKHPDFYYEVIWRSVVFTLKSQTS